MTQPPNGFPEDVLRSLRSGSLGREGALKLLAEREVAFLRLQLCDLSGALRHVDVPAARFAEALEGRVAFDGSRAGGAAWLDEADVMLMPDPATLRALPGSGGRVARVVCDVLRPDGTPFEGDPRGVLRRVAREVEEEGYRSTVGAEVEFFLLPAEGAAPEGEEARQEIVEALLAMGIAVGAAHPESGRGQHEIHLSAADPLSLADALATLKPVARAVAAARGLRVTFMPKPASGENGSGLHLHHSLLRGEENAFADAETMDGLSGTLRGFVGGILRHARGFAAITNPLVNSYKRLVPGHAAPIYATWSLQDGAALVRIPPARAERTRCEVRLADPGANPYLAVAVQLAAGLDGIRGEADPGAPVTRQTAVMRGRELQRRKIPLMPRHLGEALQALEEDRVVRGALGEYVFSHFVQARRAEWEEYAAQVHAWERERYFDA